VFPVKFALTICIFGRKSVFKGLNIQQRERKTNGVAFIPQANYTYRRLPLVGEVENVTL
jgi:hypothetical protein